MPCLFRKHVSHLALDIKSDQSNLGGQVTYQVFRYIFAFEQNLMFCATTIFSLYLLRESHKDGDRTRRLCRYRRSDIRRLLIKGVGAGLVEFRRLASDDWLRKKVPHHGCRLGCPLPKAIQNEDPRILPNAPRDDT